MLGAGEAIDKIAALRDGHARRYDSTIATIRAEEHDKERAIRDRVDPERLPAFDRMLKSVASVGDLVFSEPSDSAALTELRDIIENEIGWDGREQQEAGDYAARLREIAKMLRQMTLPLPVAGSHEHEFRIDAAGESRCECGMVVLPATVAALAGVDIPERLKTELPAERLAIGKPRP